MRTPRGIKFDEPSILRRRHKVLEALGRERQGSASRIWYRTRLRRRLELHLGGGRADLTRHTGRRRCSLLCDLIVLLASGNAGGRVFVFRCWRIRLCVHINSLCTDFRQLHTFFRSRAWPNGFQDLFHKCAQGMEILGTFEFLDEGSILIEKKRGIRFDIVSLAS